MPFVRPDGAGGYYYDQAARDDLLRSWPQHESGAAAHGEVDGDELDQPHHALADFFLKQFEGGLDSSEALTGLGRGTPIDPYRTPANPGAPAPLPESIYHQLQRSIRTAYEFFVEQFERLYERGQWRICQTLVQVVRRELVRPE